MTRTFIHDGKKVVEIDNTHKPYSGLTVINDEPEFVSREAFPETVKWTGRRSKKRLMRKYGCVDKRDIVGVGVAKEKHNAEIRQRYKNDPMVRTDIDLIKERTPMTRKATRKKYFYTGR